MARVYLLDDEDVPGRGQCGEGPLDLPIGVARALVAEGKARPLDSDEIREGVAPPAPASPAPDPIRGRRDSMYRGGFRR